MKEREGRGGEEGREGGRDKTTKKTKRKMQIELGGCKVMCGCADACIHGRTSSGAAR